VAVLLVTASYDYAGDYVADRLQSRRSRFFRLNTDQFPSQVRVTFDPVNGSVFDDGSTAMQSDQVTSVWYRRHVVPDLPEPMDDGTSDFCIRECRSLLSGALTALPTHRWLSRPGSIAAAESKPYQLSVAARLGFVLPPTLISNDPASVRAFACQRKLVAKAVSSGYIASDEGVRAIFTSRVSNEDLADLAGLELAPVIFQEWIDKASDIRVTVIAGKVFAAEILSQTHVDSRTDWRATNDPSLHHERHQLPLQLEEMCVNLTTELGLEFGAIDLALTTDGQYIFFEINPNGEWVWIEDQLGYPIADSIATWLAS